MVQKVHFYYSRIIRISLVILVLILAIFNESIAQKTPYQEFDIVVLMATPGGIASAVTAARMGMKVALVERTKHPGGLPANGLGATDIHTRELSSGFFKEFVEKIKKHYVKEYGAESQQVIDASDGYHFEPHVAEKVFWSILKGEKNIKLFEEFQFDSNPINVVSEFGMPSKIRIVKVEKKNKELWLKAKVFIDASYEGDLAAAFGCRFRTYREGKSEFGEPMAGKIYKIWGTDSLQNGSNGEADSAIQAFNYRICLSNNPKKRVKIEKPEMYNRDEFLSLAADFKSGFVSGFFPKNGKTAAVVNPVRLPNMKFDANNHHRALISTDLPEENWPWPTANWVWRDQFSKRLQDYNLGLLYFAQNDTTIPLSSRIEALNYGLPKDEYGDNNHFPRMVYVREGRRIEGKYIFTAHDALPVKEGKRPPIHKNSIATSHYAIDSHAMFKREASKKTLDGFISYQTKPFTIPYEVIVPIEKDNILIPVPISSSHVGYGCLRMEPCWMSLGHAAGLAAALSIKYKTSTSKLPIDSLQKYLIKQKVNLIYFKDISAEDPDFETFQKMGLIGLVPEFEARLTEKVNERDITLWAEKTGFSFLEVSKLVKNKTRREGLILLWGTWIETIKDKNKNN